MARPTSSSDLGMVELDQLRSDDRGVGAVRLLDEEPHGGGVEHDVVVADEQEASALDRRERVVGRAAEAGGAGRGGARSALGSTAATRSVGSAVDPASTTRTVRSG